MSGGNMVTGLLVWILLALADIALGIAMGYFLNIYWVIIASFAILIWFIWLWASPSQAEGGLSSAILMIGLILLVVSIWVTVAVLMPESRGHLLPWASIRDFLKFFFLRQ